MTGTRTALSQKSTSNNNPMVIVRASELAANGTIGVVAKGTFEKMEANKFDDSKKDYFLRGADGTLYIINETQSIKEQLNDKSLLGKVIEVEYNGKKPTKRGKGYHDFACFLVA